MIERERKIEIERERENCFLFSPRGEENRDVPFAKEEQRRISKETRVSRVGMQAAINIVLRELFRTR